jgi:hypothetical protein
LRKKTGSTSMSSCLTLIKSKESYNKLTLI